MTSEPLVVPLRSPKHQRSLTVQKIQHLAPAAALLIQGLSTIREGPHGFALVVRNGLSRHPEPFGGPCARPRGNDAPIARWC
jgi:hypothetical protein